MSIRSSESACHPLHLSGFDAMVSRCPSLAPASLVHWSPETPLKTEEKKHLKIPMWLVPQLLVAAAEEEMSSAFRHLFKMNLRNLSPLPYSSVEECFTEMAFYVCACSASLNKQRKLYPFENNWQLVGEVHCMLWLLLLSSYCMTRKTWIMNMLILPPPHSQGNTLLLAAHLVHSV